jgi:hypothetical protein
VTTKQSFLDPATGTCRDLKNVEVIDTRDELEKRILQRNKRHFTQPEETPYTQAPLNKMTSENALADFFDADGKPLTLPAGTFVETTTVMQIIQEELSNPPPTIMTTVPFDDFVTALLHWDKKNSTSPSGRHLGLYQSIVTAHTAIAVPNSMTPRLSRIYPPRPKLQKFYKLFTWSPPVSLNEGYT